MADLNLEPPEYKSYYHSPIGLVEIIGTENSLKSIYFVDEKPSEFESNPYLKKAAKQIEEYFTGQRKDFSLNYKFEGTDFQKSVWEYLLKIPYGETVSYFDIASALNNQDSIRAVGSANGKNKLSIVVPCHRVIGSDGKLTGYAGGLWRKQWLLSHEFNHSEHKIQMELF